MHDMLEANFFATFSNIVLCLFTEEKAPSLFVVFATRARSIFLFYQNPRIAFAFQRQRHYLRVNT